MHPRVVYIMLYALNCKWGGRGTRIASLNIALAGSVPVLSARVSHLRMVLSLFVVVTLLIKIN